MRTGLLAPILAIWLVGGVQAQDIVEDVGAAYRQLDYAAAESLATDALSHTSAFTVGELTDLHTYLALVAYNRGELDRARRQFLAALQLTRDLELDPVLVPPKIRDFVDTLRGAGAVPDDGVVRYVPIRDVNTEAALRSMLVPGWGQIHKGHAARGYAMAGLFAVGVAGSAVSQLRRSDARRSYEAARGSPAEDERYDVYRHWSLVRNGFLIGVAGVWVAGYLDALLSPAARRSSIAVRAAPASVSLHVRF